MTSAYINIVIDRRELSNEYAFDIYLLKKLCTLFSMVYERLQAPAEGLWDIPKDVWNSLSLVELMNATWNILT